MGNEVPADSLGDEWKGYVRRLPVIEEDNSPLTICQIFRITGGNDKQGFPMKQGVVR